MSDAPALQFVGPAADEPVRLSGPPRRLAGHLHVRNPQAKSLVVRGALTTDRAGHFGAAAAPHPLVPVVVRAGEEKSVPLRLALDPSTPPGEYAAALDVL